MALPREKIARYEIQKLLGKGGMGEVYWAVDREKGIASALKFLHALSSLEQEFFQEEVKLLTRLSHPHLVKIYDFFKEGSGLWELSGTSSSAPPAGPFFSMEYVSGKVLHKLPKTLPPQVWLDLFVQLAQGLHYLHVRNILHRDLKPSNVMVTEDHQVKLLDFGLSILPQPRGSMGGSPLGTMTYLPPEAFFGEYHAASDLFSLGVLFYEVLAGRLPFQKPLTDGILRAAPPTSLHSLRPDLPDYFCDLIHRLLELSVEKRPHSALSLLRYLNQHVEKPYALLEEETSQAIVQKVPLVGREKNLQDFWREGERTLKAGVPSLLWLVGPTGVGRSRLIEEIKWAFQLKGYAYWAMGPQDSGWLKNLVPKSSHSDVLSLTKEFIQSLPSLPRKESAEGDMPGLMVFRDLPLWSERSLKDLLIFLKVITRSKAKLLLLLEVNSDQATRIETFLKESRGLEAGTVEIKLNDLSPPEAKKLLNLATVDFPLPTEILEKLIRACGGRPLLLLQAVQHLVRMGPKADLQKVLETVPKNLEEISLQRIQNLSEAARELLAIVVTHSEPVEFTQAQSLWSGSAETLEEALLELDQEGLTAERRPGQPHLALAHPSLGKVYREALSPTLLRPIHGRWANYFLSQVGEPSEVPTVEMAHLAEHALESGEKEMVKQWGYPAAQFYIHQGRDLMALSCYQRMEAFAETAYDRAYLQAHLAPLYYRLGRWEEALQAYDLWFKDRVDDESFLQKVKHRFFTGLVYHASGRIAQAVPRLQESLAIGDSEKYPEHRPFHARVHILLGSLAEKDGNIEEAMDHFHRALKLSEGSSLHLGEVEQYLGSLHQSLLQYEKAHRHFQNCLRYYRESQRPQAEAIAHHLLGLYFREQGNLAQALEWMERGLKCAQVGGELLQEARYRENLAVVFLDQADYEKALAGVQEASEKLETLGKEEDHWLVQIHQVALYLHLGNFERAEKIFQKLAGVGSQLASFGYDASVLLLQGEGYYLQKNFSKAVPYFDQIVKREKGQNKKWNWLLGKIGIYRCQLRQSGNLSTDSDLSEFLTFLQPLQGGILELWKRALRVLAAPASQIGETDLLDLLNLIREAQKPELRIDLYELLALHLAKGALPHLAERLQDSARAEVEKILNHLPEELKMDFEKNRSLQSLDQALGSVTQTPSASVETSVGKARGASISESRFRQLSEINRQILQKNDLQEVLERVMDAAIELTGAERGFLLLKNEKMQKPFPGFEVKTARHLSQRSLEEKEFQFSMSAVREAIQQGQALLTDNAQFDPRLQEKKSVVQYQLKSILVVPFEMEGQILGVVYLDHRYQPGRFNEEDTTLLNAFASQAALAIQKAQMVAALQAAKKKLEEKVEDQAARIEVISGELAQIRDQLKYGYEEIVGKSPGMMRVFQLLDHVTETAIPVWIWGESGTGKELVARSLHFNSSRKKGPFVSENCSAIPETLLESELFGHKKGAFTHADRDRVGLFEQAHSGTLFLDEIADMSLSMQAKLLRVLQEGEIRPLGSGKKIKVDVRLVTASNRDLQQLVKEDKFRQDLFFRINGMTIRLPPLRERREDIPLLVNHFIKTIARDYSLPASEVSDEAFQRLVNYPWPGNIRELEGCIRNALLFAKGRVVTPEFLNFHQGMTELPESARASASGTGPARREEESQERQLILEALRKHGLDKEKAAEELGMSLRSLYTRMERLNIPKKKMVLAKYLEI